MTTKERVIRTSIKKVELNLKNIEALLNATPLQNILDIRLEAQELINTETDTQVILSKLKKLQEREKAQYAIFEKSKNTNSLVSKKVKLTIELDHLRNELYFIEKENNKK